MTRSRASATLLSVTERLTMPVISAKSAGWRRERMAASDSSVGSAGSPSSRAVSASRVTTPETLSQRHRPVAVAARRSLVRIASLYVGLTGADQCGGHRGGHPHLRMAYLTRICQSAPWSDR